MGNRTSVFATLHTAESQSGDRIINFLSNSKPDQSNAGGIIESGSLATCKNKRRQRKNRATEIMFVNPAIQNMIRKRKLTR